MDINGPYALNTMIATAAGCLVGGPGSCGCSQCGSGGGGPTVSGAGGGQFRPNEAFTGGGDGNGQYCGASCCMGPGGLLPMPGPGTGDCGPAGYQGGQILFAAMLTCPRIS